MSFFGRRGVIVARLAALAALAVVAGCGGSNQTRSGVAVPTVTARATATAKPVDPTVRKVFEQGMAFPKWGTQVYGFSDGAWASDVRAMREQTMASWVGMIVSLDQDGDYSTRVYAGPDTTSPDALYAGVLAARQAGLNVFVEPLLNVRQVSNNWSGLVTFSSHAQAEQWFRSYWATYEPYVKAAKAAGAGQIAIATEFEALETQYPDLWAWLAHQVKATFGGTVTYDMDHSSLGKKPPSWWKDPAISYLGVSMYSILQDTPHDIPAAEIEKVWKSSVLPQLDTMSEQVGKPIILTEIGYRNTSDCLSIPWLWHSSAPADPALQGAAYQAALAMAAGDRHIAGIYFWAWQDGQFHPAGPAIQAMRAAWAQPVAVG